MRALLLISLTLFVTVRSFASCEESYKNFIAAKEKIIQRDEMEKVGSTVAGIITSSKIVETVGLAAGADTGSALFSTYGGTSMFIGGSAIGYTIYKLAFDNLDEETKNLSLDSLKKALKLIREAKLGEGPTLAETMNTVWDEVGSDISLHDVTSSILKLNQENAFCPVGKEGPELLTYLGVIDLLIYELN